MARKLTKGGPVNAPRVLLVEGAGLTFDEFGEVQGQWVRPSVPVGEQTLSPLLFQASVLFEHGSGVVLLTRDAMDELGMTGDRAPVGAAADGHPALAHLAENGWNGGRAPKLIPWMSFWSDRGANVPRITVVCFPWLDSKTGPLWTEGVSAREFAADLARFHELTGSAFYATPGVTGIALMRAVTEMTEAPRWVHPTKVAMGGVRHAEDDYRLWEQPGNVTGAFEHTYDAVGMYLGSAGSAPLAIGELMYCQGGTFNPHRAGYWQIVRPAWNDPNVPHPCGNHHSASAPLIWVTTPTMVLLAELAEEGRLEMPDVISSWTSKGARVLRQWQEHLRDALMNLRESDGAHMRRAIKATYAETIGLLGREGGRVDRPDWRHAIIAQARVNLFRKVWRVGNVTGRWPVRIKIDALTYTSDEYDPVAAIPCGETPNGAVVTLPLVKPGELARLGRFRILSSAPIRVAGRLVSVHPENAHR